VSTPDGDPRYPLNDRGYGTHQAIADQIRPGTRVLDVGCARGDLLAALRDDRRAQVVGIESHESFAVAAAAKGIEVIRGDVSDPSVVARLDPARFDHVICADVLEHLAAPELVLRALRRVFAPGATLIASIPNVVSARARLRLAAGVWRYEDSGIFDRTHLRFYTVSSARELLEQNGYVVRAQVPVGPLSHRLGRRGVRLTALRPGLLANQVVFVAEPTLT
jgi:methionine biosynthesis protein MetW